MILSLFRRCAEC